MNESMGEFYHPGQVIVMGDGGRAKILKVNRANYLCVDEAGGKWNVRRRPNLQLSDDQDWEAKEQANVVLGSTVELVPKRLAGQYPGTYVVIKFTSVGVNLVKLGGDRNRYLKDIGRDEIRVVDA